MNKYKIIVYVLLYFLFYNYTVAQQITTSCKIKIPICNKSMYVIEPEYAWYMNTSEIKKDISISNDFKYKASKHLQSQVGIKLSTKTKNEEQNLFDNEINAIHCDIMCKIPLSNNDFEIRYRYRFQTDFDEKYSRNRIEVIQKEYTKLEPYFSIEIYSNLQMKEFEKSKIRFGITHSYNKKISFEEFFCIETKIKNTMPVNIFSLGFIIEYNHNK